MRLSNVGAVACALFVVAVACGSSDEEKPSGSTGGVGGEPAEGGTGHSGRGGARTGGDSGDAGMTGDTGGSRSGAAGDGGSAGAVGSGGSAGAVGSGGSAGAAGGGGSDVCGDCPNGACLDDGTCVECRGNEHCDDPLPYCETAEHVCVECLPADDQCPVGSYCTSNFTCTLGCKNGAACASGSCLSSHDCDHCILDTECAGGRVCAMSQCSEPCTDEGQSCGTERTCCSGHCVNTSRDIGHCGGCDTPTSMHACAIDEFCGTMGCAGPLVSNLCQNARVALVRDELPPDVAAGTVIGDALATCAPAPVVRSVPPGTLDVSNPMTGQPVAGSGELLVVAGGPFGQLVPRFLQTEGICSVRHAFVNDRYELQRTADGSVVAGMPVANATSTHDLILFEVVRDPASGTLVFIVAGFNESGTGAGAWYFENVMMPALDTFTKSWYVYEWMDGGGNQMPDSSDTFTRLGEAP